VCEILVNSAYTAQSWLDHRPPAKIAVICALKP
jgi:hypothetical protein